MVSSVSPRVPGTHLRADAVLLEDRGDELLAGEQTALAAHGEAAHAEVAQRLLVGEPEQVGLVADPATHQVLVDVGDVLERGALTGGAGMAGADHEAAPLTLLEARDLFEIGVARLDRMRRRTDGLAVARVRPQPGCAPEVELGPGGDDEVVVVDQLLAAPVALDHHDALVHTHLGRLAVHETHVEPAIHGLKRELGLLHRHTPDAHPDPRRHVREVSEPVDHGDLVLGPEPVAEIERGGLAREPRADDRHLRHAESSSRRDASGHPDAGILSHHNGSGKDSGGSAGAGLGSCSQHALPRGRLAAGAAETGASQ